MAPADDTPFPNHHRADGNFPGGKGGLWIAERIPDGEFCIAANQLRIRAIREGDPDQMFNPRLPQMLKNLHWEAYDEDGRFLGLVVVTEPGGSGESEPGADDIKLFWVDETLAPKQPEIELDNGE